MVDSVEYRDNVESPSHYNRGKIECIEYIEDCMCEQSYKDVCRANILKYASRAGHKDNELEDVMKIIKYAKFWIAKIESKK
tara:strand:- start:1153 stop:1395 length:243 start_codon:yes stop_codon:yes gene_type:complete